MVFEPEEGGFGLKSVFVVGSSEFVAIVKVLLLLAPLVPTEELQNVILDELEHDI